MADFLLHDSFDAVLFDMDGTILSSIKATERVWSAWALAHGLAPETIFPTMHGKRAVDTVRGLNLPDLDAEVEAAAITDAEIADTEGIEAIAGAAEFMLALPADRWAVVTSAPRALAQRRMAAAGLPVPPVLVTAEDVDRGKPAPDCFLLGARKLETPPGRCLVFEDAPAGIAAAEAAGCAVVVVTATHAHELATLHPKVADYSHLRLLKEAEPGFRIVGAR